MSGLVNFRNTFPAGPVILDSVRGPSKLLSCAIAAAVLAAGAVVSSPGREGESGVVGLLVRTARAAEDKRPLEWAASLDAARAAARASGKPVLVVTCWKDGLCHTCDTWRERVPTQDAVRTQCERFELAEWHYDGLGGKVITWTRENGGTSDDPAAQAFVTDYDGVVIERAGDDVLYVPAKFARWLSDQAESYERVHPRTRVPFVRVAVSLEGAGENARPKCAELDSASSKERRVLIYVGRDSAADDDAQARSEQNAARKFEKDVLDSKRAADAVAGEREGEPDWTLLRIDRSKPADAALAARLGVTTAPALVVVAPGFDKPKVLGSVTSGASLAHQLAKLFE